jgi:hypothetical protein
MIVLYYTLQAACLAAFNLLLMGNLEVMSLIHPKNISIGHI